MPTPEPHPGEWEPKVLGDGCLLNTIDTAVHACVIYNQSTKVWKVLYFVADRSPYRSKIWNPNNNQITEQIIPPWPPPEEPSHPPPALFCSGHAYMSNGNLLVAGGVLHLTEMEDSNDPHTGAPGLRYTYIFNTASEQWVPAGPSLNPHAMAKGRFYPTITTMGTANPTLTGQILAMSGSDEDGEVNKFPETYHPVTGWNLINEPEAEQPFIELYVGSHVIPHGQYKGQVFYSMPMTQSYVFNPFPPRDEYWTAIGNPHAYRSGGCSILLPLLPSTQDPPSAKVLIAGGWTGVNTAEIIDLSSGSPNWGSVSSMHIGRRNINGVILPNDRILVTGGNVDGAFDRPIRPAEIYNPETNVWTLTPSMNIYRAYHSVTLLLPDGSVWLSGTTHPTNFSCNWQHNIEINKPGYMFEGSRPQILTFPDNITFGSQFTITTNSPIEAIRLIRLASMTHSTDTDQRSVGLEFTQSPIINGHTWNVTAPADADIAPPGYYMLFVLRDKSHSSSGTTMIPSEAKIVRLS